MLDIALLKRNHPDDYIVLGSILLSQSEEESKTYDSQSLTVNFVTQQVEEGIYRLYYNQVVISAQDFEIIRATGARVPKTKSETIQVIIKND